MKGLSQVVRGSLLLQVRPEQVLDLLSVHLAPRLEGEQLDHARGLFEPPPIFCDGSGTDRDRETAEHAHVHSLGLRDRSLSSSEAPPSDGRALATLHPSTLSDEKGERNPFGEKGADVRW